MKNQRFVRVSGDFTPEIYLSKSDRDKLSKRFGRLPRGFPSQSDGMTVVSMINFALGNKDGRDPYDTEDGDSQSPKLYDYRTMKVVGKPRTVGDAAKMAGVRLESFEDELISRAAGHISHMQMAEKIDPADIDDTASEKDIENAAKNIIMQLRKSVSMRGNKDVEFADGKQKVDMRIAQKAIDMHMRMKPQDKLKFQNTIATSYKSLLNAIKGK